MTEYIGLHIVNTAKLMSNLQGYKLQDIKDIASGIWGTGWLCIWNQNGTKTLNRVAPNP